MARFTFVAVLVLLNFAAHSVFADDGECPKFCPSIYQPTCGTDGKIFKDFSNPCDMRASNCRSQRSPSEVGAAVFAQTDLAWCTSELVDNLWTTFSNLDLEKGDCLKACPMVYEPICATNGKYRGVLSNECIVDTLNCALEASGSTELFRKLKNDSC